MNNLLEIEPAVYHPGEGTEGGIVYSGYIVTAKPLLAEGYQPGEEATLHLGGHAERIGPGWSAWLSWATTYRVFKSDGTPLVSRTIHHSIAPWTTHDYAEDSFNISLGPMPETNIHGYVELWAGGSPDVLLDSRDFQINIYTGPEGKGFPWHWVALGSGLLTLAVAIAKKRQR